jgi:hypothetical protein
MLQSTNPEPSVFNYKGEPKVVTNLPESVAKGLIVWFEAPHALVIEDVCALSDWFLMCPHCIATGHIDTHNHP